MTNFFLQFIKLISHLIFNLNIHSLLHIFFVEENLFVLSMSVVFISILTFTAYNTPFTIVLAVTQLITS